MHSHLTVPESTRPLARAHPPGAITDSPSAIFQGREPPKAFLAPSHDLKPPTHCVHYNGCVDPPKSPPRASSYSRFRILPSLSDLGRPRCISS